MSLKNHHITIGALVVLFSACIFSCKEVAPASSPSLSSQTSEQILMEQLPLDLIKANIKETSDSVIITVISTEKLQQEDIYSTWNISVDVNETLKGNLEVKEKISFKRTVEGEKSGLVQGDRYLASFIRKEKELVLPGSAYIFPVPVGIEGILTEGE